MDSTRFEFFGAVPDPCFLAKVGRAVLALLCFVWFRYERAVEANKRRSARIQGTNKNCCK